MKNGLHMSGSYMEHMDEFVQEVTGAEISPETEMTEISRAYLSGIAYEIEELDEEAHTALVSVEIPDVAAWLPELVEKELAENGDMPYDELLASVQEKLCAALENGTVGKITTQARVHLTEVDGMYRILQDEAWEEAIYGTLRELYLRNFNEIVGGAFGE